MSTALLTIHLMRALTARRPDLRDAQRAEIVSRIMRLSREHAGIDKDGVLRLSPQAQSLIGQPAAPQEHPAPSPPVDTSALQDELAKEENPIRRAQIRERIGIANGVTSTKEIP